MADNTRVNAEYRQIAEQYGGRIAVAMSGGVDSSAAAALLVEQGHDIIGLTMKFWACSELGDDVPARDDLCCSPKHVRDAREICRRLGAPHYLIQLEAEFEETVIEPFVSDYENGLTPNPCVRCNERIKSLALIERVRAMGATGLATGHYARIDTDPETGLKRLKRSPDQRKDQTYFLFPLTQSSLSFIRFPLSDLTKDDTRRLAKKWNLVTADKAESNEVCFILDNDHIRFLRERIPHAFQPGPIRDPDGNEIGRHNGVIGFTRGQRRGIRVPAKHPLYVLNVDPATNTLTVGTADHLMENELFADHAHWISGLPPAEPFRCAAAVRYNSPEAACRVYPLGDGRLRVRFDEDQRAIAAGQAVVFYDSVGGDVCLGGAWITGSQRAR